VSGLTETAQQLGSDALVTLFTLDATGLGDTAVRRFTSSAWQATAVRFGGQTYTPIDVEATGFEWQGQGAPPAPGLRLANTNAVLGALARDFDDLVGAEVTRLRTFKMFLDDGDSPDGDMHFPPDLFRIERKVAQNKLFIEFELAAPFDQEGQLLPGRMMLRDACTHFYRGWTGSAFSYARATCPYVGASYFKADGTSTSSAGEDRCGKRLSDCQKRFGTAPLPTRAFPGLARVRA
jgi:lambda family phage minor tail protein L